MSTSTRITRRDFFTRWFRAPRSSTYPVSAMSSPTIDSSVPSSSPVSAATSSNAPLRLPPLQQTVLDVATTDALFRDLAACTKIHAVIPKYAARGHTGTETISLETARTRLAAGLLLGVQIRYAYDGHTWCDTLLRRPAGLTLVRIREADIEATIGPAAIATS
jgi:hypothetical protein